mgnify:CR=1 FL=1
MDITLVGINFAPELTGIGRYMTAYANTLHDAAGNYKPHITYEIVLRAQAYQLSNVFYLPSSDPHGIRECFARFDRMQFVRVEHLFPKPVRLTEKGTDILRQWSWNFLGLSVVLDPALEEFRRKAAEELTKRLGS